MSRNVNAVSARPLIAPASRPGPAQAGLTPALHTQPTGHYLPLHHQPPRPPLHFEPHQSSARPAHCH
ncbi:unnamed protein product [Tetraodon nigroviridis]|uniref:(spotted green pufferfish) hypothetical protein n=1 Tax=Tetraodon nigroviridis TaxID=99883 RepID=Q4TED8_TETNG|nr:unnamed protein product [Tetraodon nigroviridis]